jgi:hypothetical protein
MKAKHSQGTWTIGPDINGEQCIMALGRIAIIAPAPYMSEEESDANAALLAAAPRMLEALKRVYHAFSVDTGGVEGLNSKQSHAIGCVMNAIYSAEGNGA